MAKLINLIGQRFDKLIVLEKAPSKARHTYWKCQCDCGTVCEVSSEYLRANIIPRDCGCSKIKNIHKKQQEEKKNWLVGQRFGKLQVIEPLTTRNHGSVVWKCQCDCGNIKNVPTHLLTSSHTRSCGCLVRETQANDLTAKRFGKLTALYITNYKKRSSLIWHCVCDCGKECDVESYNLKAGLTRSCGCITSSIGELQIEDILLKNKILYKKEQTFSDLRGQNNKNLRYDFAIINDEQKIIRLIEFDGEQHYSEKSGVWGKNIEDPLENRQTRDKVKNEYALSHNIPLVRIPYWERDNITIEMIMGDQYLIK